MMLLAKIGAFIVIPFLALSAWLGAGIHTWPEPPTNATSTPPAATSTPPTATSTNPQPTPVSVQTAVTIYSVSQTKGLTAGEQVSITGFGFTKNNTVLLDGMVAARNVPITSTIAVACTTDPSCKGGIRQTITFTMPSSIGPDCKANEACPMYVRLLTSGTYKLSVENENGTSNAIAVTIVGAASVE